MDRRTILKVAGGATLAVLLPARAAEAGRQWCRIDPTFRFVDAADPNRAVTANIYVSTEVGATVDTTGPVELVVTVPDGIQAELVSQDDGLGYGYDITVEAGAETTRNRGHITVAAAARVPATDRHRILLEFVPDGVVEDADSAQGWTNDWVVVQTRLRFPDV